MQVRLRVDRLVSEMAARDFSPLQLERLCGQPTKRTINRWKRASVGRPDYCVRVEWENVLSVAAALEIAPDELLDRANSARDTPQLQRLFDLAASLGPVLYPDLIRYFGVALPLSDLCAGGIYRGTGQGGGYRVTRWRLCEERLGHGARLSAPQATKALDWCHSHALPPETAPELHCLCELWRGDIAAAARHGAVWLERAEGAGRFAEMAWVGARLLSHLGDRALFEPLSRIIYATVRAWVSVGRAQDALELVADWLFHYRNCMDAVALARLHGALGRVRNQTGQWACAIEEVHRGLAVLGADEAPEVRSDLLRMLASSYYQLGDADGVAQALRGLAEISRGRTDEAARLLVRLLGIMALERGDPAAALEHLEDAADLAAAAGGPREIGFGSMHLGIGLAILGRSDEARAAMERAVALFSSDDAGPLPRALVQLNFAEIELDCGHARAAVRRLEFAAAHFREAGGCGPRFAFKIRYFNALASDALGDFERARRYARLALRSALESGQWLHRAACLALCAYVNRDSPGAAARFSRDSLQLLASGSGGAFLFQICDVRRLALTAQLHGERRAAVAHELLQLAKQCEAREFVLLARRCYRDLDRPAAHQSDIHGAILGLPAPLMEH